MKKVRTSKADSSGGRPTFYAEDSSNLREAVVRVQIGDDIIYVGTHKKTGGRLHCQGAERIHTANPIGRQLRGIGDWAKGGYARRAGSRGA
jgi:hypothetical protein